MKLVVLYPLPTIFLLPLLSRVAVYSRVMHQDPAPPWLQAGLVNRVDDHADQPPERDQDPLKRGLDRQQVVDHEENVANAYYSGQVIGRIAAVIGKQPTTKEAYLS